MTNAEQSRVATGRGAKVAPWVIAGAAIALLHTRAGAIPPAAPTGPQLPPNIHVDLVYTIATGAGGATGAGVAGFSAVRIAHLEGETLEGAQLSPASTLAELTPLVPGGVMFRPDGTLLVAGSQNAVMSVDAATHAVSTLAACDAHDFAADAPPAIRDLCADPAADRAWAIADRPMAAGVTLAPAYAPGRAVAFDGDDADITGLAFTSIEENHQPYQRVFYAAASAAFSPGGEPMRSLGFVNMLTGETTRVLVNVPAARALAADPYTGDVVMAGGGSIAQVDAGASTPRIVSVLDMSTLIADGANIDLVDVTTDGRGRLYAAAADGRLVVVDYSGVDGDPGAVRLNDRGVRVRVFALEAPPAPGTDASGYASIRGLAPLSGPGGAGGAGGAGVEANDCLWDNGAADGINGQLSQVSVEQGDPETADDLYFGPGRIYRLDTLTATLSSNTVFPKARLELYDDCDGKPGDMIASFDTFDLMDTGERIDQTYAVYTARFLLGGVYVDGGRDGRTLWVGVRGVGIGTGLEEWFWQTSGHRVVKGRSGMFRSAAHGYPDWTPIDGFGCGCSDFAFAVYGRSCKVLIDGGPADLYAEPAGLLSQMASDADAARVADDVVIPPCGEIQTVCYLRAYLLSNCTPVRGRFELYEDACEKPASGPGEPIRTAAFARTTDLSYTVVLGGESMTLYAVEAHDLDWPLMPGRNYWIAPVGDTTFSLRKRAYAAFGRWCDAPTGRDGRACLSRFSPARANGRGLNLTRWAPVHDSTGTPRDLAMLVGVESRETARVAAPADTCRADIDRSGGVGMPDLFDYLTAWFAGCP